MTRTALIVLAAVWLVGCDGDDPPNRRKSELAAPVPLPECPDADYTPCDIRERACQDGLAALAACLRDDPPLDDLRIDVLSESAYTNMVVAEVTEPKPSTIAFHHALTAFQLAPVELPSAMTIAQQATAEIWGLYRASDKRIIVVDHGEPADSMQSNLTLLHEFIHALQDADYDLVNWPAGEPWNSFDSSLARKSLVEGEATFYEYRAAVPFLGLDVAQADFDSAFDEHLDYIIAKAFESDTPVNDSFFTFPYAYGVLQAYAAWQKGGPRGTDPLWASPAETTQAVMATTLGLGEAHESGIDIAAPDLPADPAPFDTPLTLSASDSLGAWGLTLLLNSTHTDSPDKLALAWRGDRLFAAQAEGSDTTYALWELELDSPESANAVDAALRINYVDHAAMGSRVYLSGAYPSSGSSRRLTAAGELWISGN